MISGMLARAALVGLFGSPRCPLPRAVTRFGEGAARRSGDLGDGSEERPWYS